MRLRKNAKPQGRQNAPKTCAGDDMPDNGSNIYKDSGSSALKTEIKDLLTQNLEKFNDPVVLGTLMYKMLEERENTNRILKNILTKLEALQSKGVQVSPIMEEINTHLPSSEPLLPDVDLEIISFIKEKGKATAEDVRAKFNYRGTNAASARMNRLVDQGYLAKQQVGKKVFFFPS